MKTPHRITLIPKGALPKYNPRTGKHEPTDPEKVWNIPCLINYISQAKIFEQYGERNGRYIIVRFMREQQPFERAEFDNRLWAPVERIDAPIKGAVRLKEVVE